ncbi:hypothetical protein ACOMHN_002057 [Nucella lapillus]
METTTQHSTQNNTHINASMGNLPHDLTTKKYDTVYLADDDSLNNIAEFIAANYIDYIYAPICATLGILGNVLAFCVLVSARRSRRNTTYVYMASLSVSDTLVQIVNILFLVRKFPGHETLKEGSCGLVFFLLYFSIHFNVVLMITMTVERYLAICFPLRAPQWFTIRRARLVVLLEAVLVFGLDVQHLILRGMVFDEKAGQYFCMPKGTFTTFYMFKIWPWVDAVIYCYVPLACLVVFNVLILRQVRLSSSFQAKTNTAAVAAATDKTSKMSDKEAQLTRMLLLVTTAFLIFVSPVAIIIVVERNYWFPDTPLEKAQYHLVRTICNNLDYTNHALNFLLYCFSGQRFRQELKQFFGCFLSGSSEKSSSSAAVNTDRDVSSVTGDGSVSTRQSHDRY